MPSRIKGVGYVYEDFSILDLVLGSTLISALMIKQIFLTRSLNQEQRILAESEETASTAAEYKTAWEQLAMHIYQASHQDPPLLEILKSADVEVRSKKTDETTPAPLPPAAAPIPSVAPKAPGAP